MNVCVCECVPIYAHVRGVCVNKYVCKCVCVKVRVCVNKYVCESACVC